VITLPTPPSNVERALGQVYREEQTGLTVVTVTLANPVAQTQDGVNLIMLFKNGTLLPEIAGATGYSVVGKTVTLGTAAIAGDRFIALYWYRSGT